MLKQLHRWSLGMDKQFKPTLYWARDYLCVLEFKVIHVSKTAPGYKQFRTNSGDCNGLNVKSMIGTNRGWQEHIDYIRAVSPYSNEPTAIRIKPTKKR